MSAAVCPRLTGAGALLRRQQAQWLASQGKRGSILSACQHASSRRSLFLATAPRLAKPPKGGKKKNKSTSSNNSSNSNSSKGPRAAATRASTPPPPAAAATTASAKTAPKVISTSKSWTPPAKQVKEKEEKEKQQSEQSQKKKGSEKQPLSTLFAQRGAALVGGTLAAGVLGYYTVPLFVTYMSGGCKPAEHPGEEVSPDAVPTGLPPMSAAEFDASLDMPEWIMGVKKLRKQLAGEASGSVLEVAVGTGRNSGYYHWAEQPEEQDQKETEKKKKKQQQQQQQQQQPMGVTSFTGVDLSADSLELAQERLRTSVPGAKDVIPKKKAAAASTEEDAASPTNKATALPAEVVNVLGGRVRLFQADATQSLPPAVDVSSAASSSKSSFAFWKSSSSPSSSSGSPAYDTILQTFGLCSVADPVALLASMAAVVRPDTGRIVLLEHGRGKWDLVNSLLDKYAGGHFSRYGCWWNRDLEAVVAKAVESIPALELVKVERPGLLQFGTLLKIELRVVSSPSKKG